MLDGEGDIIAAPTAGTGGRDNRELCRGRLDAMIQVDNRLSAPCIRCITGFTAVIAQFRDTVFTEEFLKSIECLWGFSAAVTHR